MKHNNLRSRKTWLRLAAIAAAGSVFQLLPSNGCTNFAVYSTITAIDFCSIINCSGSTFFNFCEPQAVFTDCPPQAAP